MRKFLPIAIVDRMKKTTPPFRHPSLKRRGNGFPEK
jgi:hypothetical protein